MRGVARDPAIKRHSPETLRKFAQAFQERAQKLRVESETLEAKAVRYINRAIDLEREQ